VLKRFHAFFFGAFKCLFSLFIALMGFTFLPVQNPVAVGAQGDALLDLLHRRRKLVVLDQEMNRLLVRPIHMVEINDYTRGVCRPAV
jgi:hypothetical protein